MAERQSGRRWRFRWSLRSLIVFVALVSMVLSVFVAYFDTAQIDGNVRFLACACGHTRAKISDGQVILVEPNHDKPAGTVVATVEVKDESCTLRRIGEDGTPGTAERMQVDHLGAKYYDEANYGSRPIYVLLADNWKLYPASVVTWIRLMFE
jgi:hypothetical protein